MRINVIHVSVFAETRRKQEPRLKYISLSVRVKQLDSKYTDVD
jgi:hypothetical protein